MITIKFKKFKSKKKYVISVTSNSQLKIFHHVSSDSFIRYEIYFLHIFFMKYTHIKVLNTFSID